MEVKYGKRKKDLVGMLYIDLTEQDKELLKDEISIYKKLGVNLDETCVCENLLTNEIFFEYVDI